MPLLSLPGSPYFEKPCIRKSLTCAGDSSQHPALAIFDWPGPSLAPLSEDGDTASPAIRCDAVIVWLLPLTGKYAPVTVCIHLDGRYRMCELHKDNVNDADSVSFSVQPWEETVTIAAIILLT